MANFTIRVNGAARTVDVEPATPLLYVLRNDLDLQGPRFGCGLGQCGACTVHHQGRGGAVVHPAGVHGGRREITTLEGLSKDGKLHPVQQAWIDEQVPACGFCQNGQILTAKALLDRNPQSDRRADPSGHGGHAVPLHDLLPHPGRHQARGEGDRRPPPASRMRRGGGMSTRRDFIKPSGMLVVGLGAVPDRWRDPLRAAAQAGLGPGPYPDLDFRQLDSWIVIRQDNTATFYVGKTDLGQGTGTAFRQIMSDELDIAYDRTSVRHGHHRRHRRSGRLGRLRRAPDRRLADAPRGRRGAPRAARHGLDASRRAGRPARRQRRRRLGGGGSVASASPTAS